MMSMHKIPLTPIEEAGLRAHGLDIGTPSQLSDAFRQGVAWHVKDVGRANGHDPIALPPLPSYIAKGNSGVCYYDGFQMHQYAMKYADMVIAATRSELDGQAGRKECLYRAAQAAAFEAGAKKCEQIRDKYSFYGKNLAGQECVDALREMAKEPKMNIENWKKEVTELAEKELVSTSVEWLIGDDTEMREAFDEGISPAEYVDNCIADAVA